MDFKYRDVEAMPDGNIDVTLFNGAIRTEHDAHIAALLRNKSKYLVALGSCAMEGCIGALANILGAEHALRRAALETPTTDNPSAAMPALVTAMPEGDLTLPALCDLLRSSSRWCRWITHPRMPPTTTRYGARCKWCLAASCRLGRVVGRRSAHRVRPVPAPAGKVRVSTSCGPTSSSPTPTVACQSRARAPVRPPMRAVALCVKANITCRGCYGPPDGVADQGAALLDAIAAAMDGQSDADIRRVLGTIVTRGHLYRFSLGSSFLQQLKAIEMGATSCATPHSERCALDG